MCDIFKGNNAFVESVYYVMGYTICSLVSFWKEVKSIFDILYNIINLTPWLWNIVVHFYGM